MNNNWTTKDDLKRWLTDPNPWDLNDAQVDIIIDYLEDNAIILCDWKGYHQEEYFDLEHVIHMNFTILEEK